MFCRSWIYRRCGGMACHCSWMSGLQLGRLELPGLESSGSFLVHIRPLPGLALVQLELLTPTCNLSTVWRLHGSQTFNRVAQCSKKEVKSPWPLWLILETCTSLHISHTLLVKTVTSLPRFKGRGHKPHFSMRQSSCTKNLQPCFKTIIP